MARKLRIAVSVFFGLLTVALVVLWVRSYQLMDTIWFRTPSNDCCLTLGDGKLDLLCDSKPSDLLVDGGSWTTIPLRPTYYEFNIDITTIGFFFDRAGSSTYLIIPYWFTVILSVTGILVAIAPISRFSLRTLLIATTLLAVVLGFVVRMVR